MNPFRLYELAVTNPAPLARFLEAVHGGGARVLGEDFSGSAALSHAWVDQASGFRAVAVDSDSRALRHAGASTKIRKVCRDVLGARLKVDILAATNFPICYQHTRGALLTYLRHARSRLNAGGIVVADLYGGPSALRVSKTTRTVRAGGFKFSYTWDQQRVDALSGRVFNAIHFRVPARGGGSRVLRNAFVYDWRLWTIAELREAMEDAGFRATEVHDRLGGAVDQDGRLYVRPAEAGELDEDYVVYVVGRR